jgi:hypothetical protein
LNNRAAFSPLGTFAMIAAGFVSFVILMAWLGTGLPAGNDGGAHGLGKGITGYAGLAALLSAEGRKVEFNRVPREAGGRGLRILTPLAQADAKDIEAQIRSRRMGLGPTILITPKWVTVPLESDPRVPQGPTGKAWARVFGAPRPPAGWTTIYGSDVPRWKGFLDRVAVHLGYKSAPPAHGWRSADGTSSGRLPDDRVVLSGGGFDDADHPLVPLVLTGDGRILAGYFADGGSYPALEEMAGTEHTADQAETPGAPNLQPLVIVFEPDLMNNRGLADKATGLLARRLVVATGGNDRPIVFDVSLAGLGASRNLLTLAFTPPFLAATICLILAMAGSIWRGFARFGPALAGAPADRVGRIALVEGGAALLLRARRYHLITAPYAEAVRERLIVALGLPRRQPVETSDAAIERIQRAVAPGTVPFGEAVARLGAAHRPGAIAAQAASLHAIEVALGDRNRDRPKMDTL